MIHIIHFNEVVHAGLSFPALLAVYVDPGSGSYYFQMLIAGLTTVFFFFSTIKRKILSFFKKPEPPATAPAELAQVSTDSESKDKRVAQ